MPLSTQSSKKFSEKIYTCRFLYIPEASFLEIKKLTTVPKFSSDSILSP